MKEERIRRILANTDDRLPFRLHSTNEDRFGDQETVFYCKVLDIYKSVIKQNRIGGTTKIFYKCPRLNIDWLYHDAFVTLYASTRNEFNAKQRARRKSVSKKTAKLER